MLTHVDLPHEAEGVGDSVRGAGRVLTVVDGDDVDARRSVELDVGALGSHVHKATRDRHREGTTDAHRVAADDVGGRGLDSNASHACGVRTVCADGGTGVHVEHDHIAPVRSEEVASGNVEVDGERIKILAEKLERAEQVFQKAKRLIIKVGPEQQEKMALLKELFKKHAGKMECVLKIDLPDLDKEIDLQIKDPKGVHPSSEFFESVSTLLVDPQWRLV